MRKLVIIFLAITLYSSYITGQYDQSTYILGHSLLDYRPNSNFDDEFTVPHWLHQLSIAAGTTYAGGGKYGFLPQHRIYSDWFAQWGYNDVTPCWDSDNETFDQSSINSIMITAANFIQNDIQPDEDYYGQLGVSPVSCLESIIDSSKLAKSGLRYYIYENWPEMNIFTNNSFPPTSSQFQAYNNYTQTTFHQWWLDYQDFLLSSRTVDSVRLIPVGPILGQLFTDTLLTNIPYTSLYVDGDPHGTPSLYFLASMVTYMVLYSTPCPIDISLPSTIHPDIISNYSAVNTYIWDQLQTYTDNNGYSRVFYGSSGGGSGTSSQLEAVRIDGGGLYISDPNGIVLHGLDGNCYQLFIDLSGSLQTVMVNCP